MIPCQILNENDYYDNLKSELRGEYSSNLRNWILSFKDDSSVRLLFGKKITEKENEISEEQMYKNRIYQSDYEKEWKIWLMERADKRIEVMQKDLKRFLYYWKICKNGQQKDDLNIQQAKEFPIGGLFHERGNVSGNKVFFHCPYHNEKTGSLCWYKEDNHFYCYGCLKSGDAIDICMKLNDLSFIEAVKFLS